MIIPCTPARIDEGTSNYSDIEHFKLPEFYLLCDLPWFSICLVALLLSCSDLSSAVDPILVHSRSCSSMHTTDLGTWRLFYCKVSIISYSKHTNSIPLLVQVGATMNSHLALQTS